MSAIHIYIYLSAIYGTFHQKHQPMIIVSWTINQNINKCTCHAWHRDWLCNQFAFSVHQPTNQPTNIHFLCFLFISIHDHLFFFFPNALFIDYYYIFFLFCSVVFLYIDNCRAAYTTPIGDVINADWQFRIQLCVASDRQSAIFWYTILVKHWQCFRK